MIRALPRRALLAALAAATALAVWAAACRDSPEPAPERPAPRKTEPDLATLAGRPVLLLTHVTPALLRELATLRRSGLLPVPDLYVLAMRHEREWDAIDRVHRLAKRRKLDWFGVHTVRCDLPPGAVFRENDCTPELRRLVALASGVLVPGGPDLPPSLYGEQTALETRITSPMRHRLEATLLWHLVGRSDAPLLAERPELPVLAICLGMQTLNVAAGGDLVQDLRRELYDVQTVEAARALPRARQHRSPHWELHPAPSVTPYVWHPITPKGRPELWSRLVPDGRPVDVLSNHHQAVDRLGSGLEVLATSADGRVPEALGHTRFPRILGVQFHPEPRALYDPDRKARSRPGGKVKNVLARRMSDDPRVLRLHQELWRMFAGWVVEEAARRPPR